MQTTNTDKTKTTYKLYEHGINPLQFPLRLLTQVRNGALLPSELASQSAHFLKN